jgi:AAA domain-containing protein
MGLLEEASDSSFVKAAFYGEGGSGKTHTATLLALGIRKQFGLEGNLAFLDTERGSDYLKSRIEKATGKKLLVRKSRSLVDLLGVVPECIDRGVSVLIVDSVTHIWREVCDSYLAELREVAKQRKWRVPDRLEFQDWNRIKGKWAQWADLFLNSPLHIIVCGRVGDVYEQETDDRGKKQQVKVGTKMKAEKEFQYEPGLLVEFEHDYSNADPPEKVVVCRVIKDRFDLINGKECTFPTYDFFKPHVDQLNPSAHTQVDVSLKTTYGLDEHRADDWQREREQRVIMSEKIVAAMKKVWPGRTDAEQAKKAEALEKYWHSSSWTEVSEKTPSMSMAQGLMLFERDHNLGDHPPDLNVEGK